MTQIILGCDIGRVIVDDDRDETHPDFTFVAKTKEVPGAIDALRRIVSATRGPDGKCNVHLVSACVDGARDEIRRWLGGHEFDVRTGIPSANVHFCPRRRDKAAFCAAFRITDFVDDRLEVLGRLTSVRRKFLFRPDPNEVGRFIEHLMSMYLADSWDDIASFLTR